MELDQRTLLLILTVEVAVSLYATVRLLRGIEKINATASNLGLG